MCRSSYKTENGGESRSACRTDIPPVLCITNRQLCREPFLDRIEKIAAAGVQGIILREKDLSEAEYADLAAQVIAICDRHNTPCVLHGWPETAHHLNSSHLHLPLPVLRQQSNIGVSFPWLSTSVHSLEETREAIAIGANHLIAGHIFATDCKKGLPPRGLEFLQRICSLSEQPIYAIGGISPDNASSALETGAKGVCVMSGLMQCENPARYLLKFREKITPFLRKM